MAGSPQPVPEAPKLGMKATIAGLVFVILVLTGFGAATAASYDGDSKYGDEYGDDYGDEYGDDYEDGE